MKEIFFKGVVIVLPLVVLGGLAYLIFHGFYALYADIRLKKELARISRESATRRQQEPQQSAEKSVEKPADSAQPPDLL